MQEHQQHKKKKQKNNKKKKLRKIKRKLIEKFKCNIVFIKLLFLVFGKFKSKKDPG